MKRTYVNNVKDFKDEEGLWVKSFYPESYHCHHTRSGGLWAAVNYRCKPDSKMYVKNPTYLGCTNDYASYQSFAEWCNNEYGYLNKTSKGVYWHLDKDILKLGNKSYSEETCLFVPNYINSLFVTHQSSRGDYPLGVTYQENAGKLKAQCKSFEGKTRYLGLFHDPMEAHRAWQQYKIKVFQEASVLGELQDHLKLRAALEVKVQEMLDDYNNYRETY